MPYRCTSRRCALDRQYRLLAYHPLPFFVGTKHNALLEPASIGENMQVQMLKSKIHRVHVTEANLDYIGSITIDEALMEAANLLEGERVSIVNVNNGERFDTYTIRGARNSGVICLNGPAARKCAVNDIVIIIAYGIMELEEAKTFQPSIIFPDTATNKLNV